MQDMAFALERWVRIMPNLTTTSNVFSFILASWRRMFSITMTRNLDKQEFLVMILSNTVVVTRDLDLSRLQRALLGGKRLETDALC